MRLRTIPILVIALGLFLTACGSATPGAPTQLAAPPTTGAASRAAQPDISTNDLTRTDNQGAVEVTVTPLNLEDPRETLNFDIVLDTHSVDLSMDLATLATLKSDTGMNTQATLWDAPRGGHHVEGTLSFPASVGGKSFLDGAKTLILTIKELDAPERSFTWNLTE